MTGELYDDAGRPKPIEIKLKKQDKQLLVSFSDGHAFQFPAELLRVESPSAEVQGHSPTQKQIVSGRRHVGIMGLEPVGNYAIRISFDDLHDTGLFSWSYLYEMGLQQETVWETYLENLSSNGLSREP